MSVPFANGRPVPAEVLERIAYELAASEPLGNPALLLPLLVTSKAIHGALSMDSGTLLYSKICKLKFDIAAVTRRAFTPRLKDLNGHLVQMCTLLKFIRAGDVYHEDVDDQLLIAYVAMLDNDGKNRAQLEHVGIVDFVDRVVRLRLGEGKDKNQMWPVENLRNACALWLKWMFTTREELLRETTEQREQLIGLVFPYLVCPHRYTSALVPPNHFILPLGRNNPVQKDIFTMQTAHGRYPVYHTNRISALALYYFRSNTTIMEPLIAPVASLLFWSRRELHGSFEVPAALPLNRAVTGPRPGLTQEDLIEFNSFKVAKLPPVVRWDWEQGIPMRFADDGAAYPWRESDSERWDISWWRGRLCDSIFHKQPKFRLGSVYVRGMLTGLWHGIQFWQGHEAFNNILAQRQCPPNLSEITTDYSGRPMFFRLKEHGFVRTPCPKSGPVEQGGIPGAPPAHMPITVPAANPSQAQEAVVPVDVSLGNAWFPGPIGSVRWVEDCESLDAGVLRDRYHPQPSQSVPPMRTVRFLISNRSPLDSSNSHFTAQPGGPVEASMSTHHAGKTYVYETYDSTKESVHKRMAAAKEQMAMSSTVPPNQNQAFSSTDHRGPQLHPGCLRCTERKMFLMNRKLKDTGRPKLDEEEIDRLFSSVGMGKMFPFLPDEPPTDDGSEERMQVIDLDLENDDHESEDGDEDSDEESAFDQDDHEHAREESENLVCELVPVSASDAPSPSPGASSRSSSVSANSDHDDDDVEFDGEQGHPGLCDSAGRVHMEPIRRSHDRYRVENCDEGVEDVVVTGTMDERHSLAWGNSVYYGRVRPWDGMVAILRIGTDHNAQANTHNIYYGYIYGGDTFVGHWRYAGMDPLAPAFECPFIMSKREE